MYMYIKSHSLERFQNKKLMKCGRILTGLKKLFNYVYINIMYMYWSAYSLYFSVKTVDGWIMQG